MSLIADIVSGYAHGAQISALKEIAVPGARVIHDLRYK